MAFDSLADRKDIHLKLDKHVFMSMKASLFHYGLSMQEVFEEFARLFITENPDAVKMVKLLTLGKMNKAILDNGGVVKRRKRQPSKHGDYKQISELDHDTLYDLINEAECLEDKKIKDR